MALLLMSVLFISTAFAGTEESENSAAEGQAQAEQTAEEGEDIRDSEKQGRDGDKKASEEKPGKKEKKNQAAEIVKKGKYYYYKSAGGAIRKKAGFVQVNKKIYYVTRGGKIKTNDTFRVEKKYYRANRHGVIKTGVYKWKGDLYFSYPSGRWKKKEGLVEWNGDQYYVQKGGRILTDDGFVIDNVAYIADDQGCVSEPVFPEKINNKVIKIAKKQVGIMTGKTYWVWYYKTRFQDTDRTPWCGAFVAWCYNKAGLYDKISVANRFGSLGYVPSYSRFADSYRKWINRSKARPGDIIVLGRSSHIGLVEGVYDNYIITIEGNAGPTAVIGCGKPGAVIRRIYKLDNEKIKGVIRVLS